MQGGDLHSTLSEITTVHCSCPSGLTRLPNGDNYHTCPSRVAANPAAYAGNVRVPDTMDSAHISGRTFYELTRTAEP